MTAPLDRFRRDYQAALGRHLLTGGEGGLAAAYQLGRSALAEGIGLLDIAAAHFDATSWTLQRLGESSDGPAMAEAANQFFMQSLATFEMTQRGFWEAQERANIERHLVAQLQRLAAASVAILGSITLVDRLATIAEQAHSVVGGDQAAVTFTGNDRELSAATARPPASTAPSAAAVVAADRSRRVAEDGPNRLAWLGVALHGHGGSVSGLLQVWRVEPPFTSSDQAVLEQLGQLASLALDNARLFEIEHRIAITLQKVLLPDALPTVNNVHLAARYVPAGPTAQIGGDWYDVIELPNNRVGLALGDVMGHGIRAAAVMAQLRLGLRAYVMDGYGPCEAVDRVDRLLQRLDPSHIATLIYAVLDLASGKLTFVNAGHPPAILLDASGRSRFVTEGLSVLLGVDAPAVLHREELIQIEPGSLLLLYSDGLVEDLNLPIGQGLLSLQGAVDGYTGSPDGLCDLVLSTMADRALHDDVCLLAIGT